MDIGDQDRLRALYFEVVRFFASCGGIYRAPHATTYHNIADALAGNRAIIRRVDSEIKSALFYWRIRAEDVEKVKHGWTPPDKGSGNVVYICEYAGTDGRRGLFSAIAELKRRYQGDACWHEQWMSPDRFRYYRRPA